MKLARFAALTALSAVVTVTAAQEIHNWRSTVTGRTWKDGSGQCWRDGSWTPATAAPDCDGAIVAKPPAVVPPAPVPIPPVVAPQPVVAPVPEPEPVPMVTAALQAAPETVLAPTPVPEAVPAAAPPPAAVLAPAVAVAPVPTPAPPVVPAKMSFAADTFFDFDKSVLKPEGKAKLKELVEKIKNISLEVVIVVGHTDSVGTDAYNLKLSERRAEAVKAYLVSLGVSKNRVYTEGKGESEPTADNKTAAGRAKNRRVEVEVIGSK